MRLKSIEMQGFKSFAEKINLDFNTGITAVVGPNGSGKSNIADAIKWVMGEQSVKSLRGSKMEDVIFAGTEARKALGFAEVSLILDNSDGYFPLDFSEIRVTRRVYRSGDGEYSINKTPCRLKDIHELFMDTGLGRDGYSMIGQGKIDNILSTKSEDRRQIFEEAAGISKYKYRKIEAERKLVQTTENLTRVKDILTELEGQLSPLKRQSEKAKQYLKLRDSLKELEIQVSVISIDNLRTELADIDENLDIVISQISEINAKIAEVDEKVSALYDEISKKDEEIEKRRLKSTEITDNVHALKTKSDLLNSDILHTEENIKRLEDEIAERNKRTDEVDERLKQGMSVLEELNSKNAELKLRIQTQEEEALKAGLDVGEKNTELEGIKNNIIEESASINSLKSSNENLNRLLESFAQRKNDIENELSDKVQQFDEMNISLEKLDVEISQMHDEISKHKSTISKYTQELDENKAKLQKIEDTKNESTLRLRQDASKRHMLEDMERAYDGYAKSVKSVMQAIMNNEIKDVKIYGPLAQLVSTDTKFVVAIETALGAANQNIVTEAEEDAKTAIEYLKENRLGRATFLPVRAIKEKEFSNKEAKSMKGFIDVASNVVKCDGRYKNIISNLLGTTAIVDNLDNAVLIAKKTGHKFKIVTLLGDVIQPGGAMTGGSVAKSTSSLSRTSEIEKLKAEEKELKKTIADSEKELLTITKALETLDAELKENEDVLNDKNEIYIRLCSDRDHSEQNLLSVGEMREQLAEELEDINKQIEELKLEISAQEKGIEDKTKNVAYLESELVKKQQIYDTLSQKNAEISAIQTELSIKQSTVLKDIEMQNERILSANEEKSLLLDEIMKRNAEIEENRKSIKAFGDEIAETAREAEKLVADDENNKKLLDELIELKKSYENDIRKYQADSSETLETVTRLTQQQTKLEGRKERNEADLEGIINRIWEEYELTYSEALKLKKDDDFDYQAASKEIRSLRNEIKELGNINIDAIEEYKSVEERFTFLKAQTEDLEKAKRNLEEVISEMLNIMREQFTQQFSVINKNFSRVFAEMFGGGRANLTLSDPDNVLESGIEIEAQPPGKKLQSLTLLSGGERAFTAIALLFAILDVRPTPFCILDEIEAALDDVNVYRYADYLKQYSQKTQFIVITHRRGTMEAANILYGVTMQERGVSKLLSLNIDEVKE